MSLQICRIFCLFLYLIQEGNAVGDWRSAAFEVLLVSNDCICTAFNVYELTLISLFYILLNRTDTSDRLLSAKLWSTFAAEVVQQCFVLIN